MNLPSEPSKTSAANGNAPPVRVLIVDDNEDAADLLGEFLGGQGFAIRTANGGNAALRAVESFAYDVALLDIGMPGMDGVELAKQLRARSGGDRSKLVAVTGYGPNESGESIERAGFDAHVVKPVELSKLEELIRKLVSTSER